MDKVR